MDSKKSVQVPGCPWRTMKTFDNFLQADGLRNLYLKECEVRIRARSSGKFDVLIRTAEEVSAYNKKQEKKADS